jgi:hypothetical protein
MTNLLVRGIGESDLEPQGENLYLSEEALEAEAILQAGIQAALSIESKKEIPNGLFAMGSNCYLLSNDKYKTETSRALFVLSGSNWVSFTETDLRKEPEVVTAQPEHFAQLINDLMIEYKAAEWHGAPDSRLSAAEIKKRRVERILEERKQAEDKFYRQGLSDYMRGERASAAAVYWATLQS